MPPRPPLAARRLSWWWLAPALGLGALLWLAANRGELADPILPWDLLHRTIVALGLIVMVISFLRLRGQPLRARLRGYYRATLPGALFAIIVGGNAHWLTRQYFATAPVTVSSDGFIVQTTGISCAPASIANLLRLYGIPATEGELAVAIRLPFTGAGNAEINRGLAASGFASRTARATPAELRRNNRPCLISIRLASGVLHSCVLLAIAGDSWYLADPLWGMRVLPPPVFDRMYSGEATFAAPPGAPPPYDFSRPFDLARVPGWRAPVSSRVLDRAR